MNLVTGATGLLGSHIVEQLRRRNQPVRVLVRPGSDRSWLLTQGVEFAEGDITDERSLQEACRGCEAVYHAAARVGDWGPWEEFQRITIDGTQKTIDAAISARVRRFAPDGRYLGAWGKPGSDPGEFDRALAVAASPDGRVYIADTENHRVQAFDAAGKLLGVWGRAGMGDGEFLPGDALR